MSAVWDRNKARDVLEDRGLDLVAFKGNVDGLLDALEACVTPAPAHTIDRDALVRDAMQAFFEHDGDQDRDGAEALVDRMVLHSGYLSAAPDRDVIAAAIQDDFDVRSPSALRVADRILALVRPVEGGRDAEA